MSEIVKSRVGEPEDKADFPIRYFKVHSHRFTFEAEVTRKWVESWLRGRVLNAFAGEVELSHPDEIIRNDANPERPADIHVDAAKLDQHFEPNSFNSIVHDPPWSARQGLESYKGFQMGEVGRTMRGYDRLLKPGGIVISLGFTMSVMPAKYAYERLEMANFETIGRGDDYFGVVVQKMNHTIGEWSPSDE